MPVESDLPLVVAGASLGAIAHALWQRFVRPAVREVIAT